MVTNKLMKIGKIYDSYYNHSLFFSRNGQNMLLMLNFCSCMLLHQGSRIVAEIVANHCL